MELKQLKATLQLAQMRFDSDPSEANETILSSAQEAYEACKHSAQPALATTNPEVSPKTESQKNDQVSGKIENPAVPEGTGGTGDASGDQPDPSTTAETGDASGQTSDVDPTDENTGTGSETQKKTDLDSQAE